MNLEDEDLKDKNLENNNENYDNHDCDEQSSISINCDLEVEIDNRNRAIYLRPGLIQYFTAKALKNCGEVTLRYKGDYSNKGICGKLGVYRIIENGIVVHAHKKLDPNDIDILCFTVTDKCENKCIKTSIVFSCDPDKCNKRRHIDCC